MYANFFPDEIVSLILIQLPADDLYNSMRYVCKQWYAIIHDPDFIKEHLGRGTTSGLLVHCSKSAFASLTKFREHNANFTTKVSLPFASKIYSTNDGSAVVGVNENFYVTNLLTRQYVSLPCIGYTAKESKFIAFTLVRTQSSSYPYEVFVTYQMEWRHSVKCVYLTVGKDSEWKNYSPAIADKIRSSESSIRMVLCIGRVIYWICNGIFPILAYDVDMEKFYELPNPLQNAVPEKQFWCVPGGKMLSLIVGRASEPVFDVYFVDIIGGCGYRPIKIDLFGYTTRWLSAGASPVAWVENGETLIFHRRFNSFISYDVKTRKSFEFSTTRSSWNYCFFNFSHSFVQLPTC